MSYDIAETLEDAGNGAHVAPVLEFGYVFLLAFDTVGPDAAFHSHIRYGRSARPSWKAEVTQWISPT